MALITIESLMLAMVSSPLPRAVATHRQHWWRWYRHHSLRAAATIGNTGGIVDGFSTDQSTFSRCISSSCPTCPTCVVLLPRLFLLLLLFFLLFIIIFLLFSLSRLSHQTVEKVAYPFNNPRIPFCELFA